MNKMVEMMQPMVKRCLMKNFHHLLSFGGTLLKRESQVKAIVHDKIKTKIFYRWFDGYFGNLQKTYKKYTDNLKIKVFKAIFLEKRRTRIQLETAWTK
jgi:hypothetical protein